MRILPYRMGSESARDLANSLGLTRVYLSREFRNNFNHSILNWGESDTPRWSSPRTKWLNPPSAVGVCHNKISTFTKFREAGVSCPEFTTDPQVAARWALECPVVGRKTVTGSGGRGIVIYELPEGLQELPAVFIQDMSRCLLFTKYKKKRKEFRVHVFKGEVIHTQEKRKERNVDDRNDRIRNRDNGWVFCVEGITPSTARDTVAISAVQSLGLDFGAVDIIWNERENQYYALEVNSAPGIEGSTLQAYRTAIEKVGY